MGEGRPYSIVGTVPPQHMFGFESTVLLPLQSGAAIHAGHPFYPADIVSAIRAVTRPRLLVTTPVHLRVLMSADAELPALDLLLSATAPLEPQLAQTCESRFTAPLFEIYGSTETGQIASRRSAQTREWELFPDVNLTPAGRLHVGWRGPCRTAHAHARRARADRRPAVFAARAPGRPDQYCRQAQFAGLPEPSADLHSRRARRCLFMPDDGGHGAVVRLMAFAVAPGLSAAALQAALKERIDPVFLPRPLVLLDALPRNSTGKLPREALQALARRHQAPAGGGTGHHAG
ncbi:AMP-binding protein [Polaromonas sp. P1(28)-8]|nr:AMP-binding protein [Polaromonas sp. P1(28)-8]